MGSFAPDFLERLRQNSDIVSLIGSYVKLTRAGESHKGLCPFHKEKTPSFHVHGEKGVYYCFGCHAKGDALTFLREYHHINFVDAVLKLASLRGMEVVYDSSFSHKAHKDANDKKKRLMALVEMASVFFQNALREENGTEAALIRTYIKERGITDDIRDRFSLGFAPPHDRALRMALEERGFTPEEWTTSGLYYKKDKTDKTGACVPRFRSRLIFPIHDNHGHVVGFGGRSVKKSTSSYPIPKYINSPQTPLFHKKDVLYGLHHAADAIRTKKRAILVEGYMDVITLYRCGFQEAVAPLGTALSVRHVQTLWRRGATVFVCLDGDDAGRRAATRLAHLILPVITAEKSLFFIFLPPHEDPDSMMRQGEKAIAHFNALLDKPHSLASLLWQDAFSYAHTHAPPSTDPMAVKKSPEYYARAKKQLLKDADAIQDDVLRKEYAQLFKDWFFSYLSTRTHKQQRPKSRFGMPPPPHIMPSRATQRGVGDKEVLSRQDYILAALIHHPHLLDEFIEDVLRIQFATEELTRCAEVLALADRRMSSQALQAWLSQQGCATIKERLCSHHVALFSPEIAPTAHPRDYESKITRGTQKIAPYGASDTDGARTHLAHLIREEQLHAVSNEYDTTDHDAHRPDKNLMMKRLSLSEREAFLDALRKKHDSEDIF
ncbi:MAG: DNA primase [Alphaproteobacteria bacterium GM7ARS4]|nr:DNA primase [Alphaproteobacteria bacterium GM7ARS4]